MVRTILAACLVLTGSALGKPPTVSSVSVGVDKAQTQPAASQPADARRHDLPWSYQWAAKQLDLDDEQIQKVAEAYDKHKDFGKKQEETVRQRIEALQRSLQEAIRKKDRQKQRDIQRELQPLWPAQRQIMDRRYALIQKDVMAELSEENRKDWPALVLAADAMGKFHWQLTEEQVNQIRDLCLKIRDRIARVKTLPEVWIIVQEIQQKIFDEVLTNEQRVRQNRCDLGLEKGDAQSQPAANPAPPDQTAPKAPPPGPGAGGW